MCVFHTRNLWRTRSDVSVSYSPLPLNKGMIVTGIINYLTLFKIIIGNQMKACWGAVDLRESVG